MKISSMNTKENAMNLHSKISKLLIPIFGIETVLIILAISLSISFEFHCGIIIFSIIYKPGIVLIQSIVNFALIISMIYLLMRKRTKETKSVLLCMLILALNTYVIYLCMFTSTPNIFDVSILIDSTKRFIKLISLGVI